MTSCKKNNIPSGIHVVMPDKDELKANGFLDKRAAIATITDLVDSQKDIKDSEQDKEEEEKLEDFISNN